MQWNNIKYCTPENNQQVLIVCAGNALNKARKISGMSDSQIEKVVEKSIKENFTPFQIDYQFYIVSWIKKSSQFKDKAGNCYKDAYFWTEITIPDEISKEITDLNNKIKETKNNIVKRNELKEYERIKEKYNL